MKKTNENLWGGIFIDLGKLIFAGVVLGTVVHGPFAMWALIVSGLVCTVIALFIGVYFKEDSGKE
jgi:hypothetical protein